MPAARATSFTRAIPPATGSRSEPPADARKTDHAPAGEGVHGALARRCRLPDLDQVAVGIAHVAADLGGMLLRLGQELGALRAPVLIALLDVRHPDVEKCARLLRVRRRLE